MSELESGFRVADATALLRRRWTILAAAAAAGLVLGAIVYAISPTRYSATARVRVAISNPDASQKDLAADRQTQADLVRSDAVGNQVIKKLKLDIGPRELFADLTLTVKDTSDVIGLTYEAWEPEVAQKRVNAIAKAYLDVTWAKAKSAKDANVADLQRRLDLAQQQKDDAAQDINATAAGSPERIDATRRYDAADRVLTDLQIRLDDANATDPTTGAELVGEAPLPKKVMSKLALGKGVGTFGVFVLIGLAAALVVDRRDALGGGRRHIEKLIPGVTIRMLPRVGNGKTTVTEVDAAVDRLAIDLTAGHSPGRAASVVLAGTGDTPPLEIADQIASSLAFAGVPALLIIAGPSIGNLDYAHVVTAFADLADAPSITGPASLPEVAGADVTTTAPTVTWLRPRGSVESSGLLRRAVVESLVDRAGRDGFDVVIFLAASPIRNAAAAAIGQWTDKAVVIVEDDDSSTVEAVVAAMRQADIAIDEVVWT